MHTCPYAPACPCAVWMCLPPCTCVPAHVRVWWTCPPSCTHIPARGHMVGVPAHTHALRGWVYPHAHMCPHACTHACIDPAQMCPHICMSAHTHSRDMYTWTRMLTHMQHSHTGMDVHARPHAVQAYMHAQGYAHMCSRTWHACTWRSCVSTCTCVQLLVYTCMRTRAYTPPHLNAVVIVVNLLYSCLVWLCVKV